MYSACCIGQTAVKNPPRRAAGPRFAARIQALEQHEPSLNSQFKLASRRERRTSLLGRRRPGLAALQGSRARLLAARVCWCSAMRKQPTVSRALSCSVSGVASARSARPSARGGCDTAEQRRSRVCSPARVASRHSGAFAATQLRLDSAQHTGSMTIAGGRSPRGAGAVCARVGWARATLGAMSHPAPDTTRLDSARTSLPRVLQTSRISPVIVM
jgi:hypothetical protein